MSFDPTAARLRLARLWALGACVGVEREAQQVYLDEIVSDRGALTHGLQVLRDELQFAGTDGREVGDLAACRADFTLPSVVTTLAHTNCGDRIQSGSTTDLSIVGSRPRTRPRSRSPRCPRPTWARRPREAHGTLTLVIATGSGVRSAAS